MPVIQTWRYLSGFLYSKRLQPPWCENTKRPQPVFTVHFACFILPALVRRGKWQIYACLLTQTSALYLPSQTFRTFSGITDKAPSIQWRDRAGLSPASILASCPAARSLQSAAQEEHKLSFVILFSLISIAQAGNKYNPLAMYNMQCAAKKLHIFAEIKQKRV